MQESRVYFQALKEADHWKNIAKALESIFKKLAFLQYISEDEFAAIKLHFGEKGNLGYIKPLWLKNLINYLGTKTKRAFLTDTNTLYRENRFNAAEHLKLAFGHGFGIAKLGIPVIIADGLIGRNYREIKINQKHFQSLKIAADIFDSPVLIVLTHVTGHCQTGLGAALKNLGMGCASRAGKLDQHMNTLPGITAEKCKACGLCIAHCPAGAITLKDKHVRIDENKCIGCGECIVVCRNDAVEIKYNESIKNLQEKMVEYAWGVYKTKSPKICFINFLTHVTKDCDCMASDEGPITEDLGILASYDPVAIDQACADLINQHNRKDLFKEVYPDINWEIQLDYAEKLGMGRRKYELIK